MFTFVDDIYYYEDYKNKLCQFIINGTKCTRPYGKQNNKSFKKKIHLTNREMLGLLKEIQEINILVYNLKQYDK